MSATITSINPGLAKLLPEKLSEAREAFGLNLTELAECLGVTRQAVSRYELGTLTPSPDIMTKLAATLEQPLIFFTSVRPTSTLASGAAFFRSFKSTSATSRRICLRQRQWLIDGYSYLSQFVNFPETKVEEHSQDSYSQEDIESIAKQCRRSWGLGDGPIYNMVELLEAHGFVVARAQFGQSKIDAFSFWHGSRPYIFLGADKSSACRSRFDAAHELGHMVLHGGITLEQLEDPDTLKRIEKEADRFASAFLLPLTSFPNEIFSSKLSHFIELKKRWKASMAAMIYRCSTLEIFSEEQVLNLRKQMSMQKMRANEPLDDVIPIETPTSLAKAANLILQNQIKYPEEFVNDIGLASATIGRLFALPLDFFEPRRASSSVSLISVK
jgi:Zn-dependent peptidase ImmA (M78 family)/transcriptional regulator with XRE-family HTH domain